MENQKSKIVDELILVFSRISLSKFSMEALTFRGYKGIYSKVREECEKSFLYKTGHSGDSLSRLEQVTSLSHEITAKPDCTFCLVVL